MRRALVTIGTTLLLLWGVGSGGGPGAAGEEEPPPTLPTGPGIAAAYPGDDGLEGAEGVRFVESFESGTIADLGARWSERKNPGGTVLRFVEDAPEGAAGHRALEVTATVGENTGGHLYRTYDGLDTVFLRFHVKFLDEAYIHHFVTFGGYRPATRWPQGHAGERPDGDERFTVAIEPHGRGGRVPPPGAWTFYNYWQEMKISADGRHWGNGLRPPTEQRVPLRRWQCVEVMVKLNSAPEVPDGELALWLDGDLVAHFRRGARRGPWSGMGFELLEEGGEPFEGFRWRKDVRLQANFLTLSLYVTERAMRRNRVRDPDGRQVRVLFDDVVLADRYVGPIRRR
ncbi:MAG: hypothetical protein ACYTG6_00640 [Planctomycetota bacterium]